MKKEEMEAILTKCKEDEITEVVLQFSDLYGEIKGVTIPMGRLEGVLKEGNWFDGSSIEGFARIHESDMYLVPDPSTYARLPWEDEKVARMICDVYRPDGSPYECDPRYILKKAVAEAERRGLTFNTGPELEFFLFAKNGDGEPTTHDTGGYFGFGPTDMGTKIRREIVNCLTSMGLEVEMSHHEVAPGQHEIDFKYGDALSTADRTMTFRQVVKMVAAKHGLHASFMPKPVFGINGSGMHVHQSLFTKDGKNLFYNADDEYKLSDEGKHFIAGQLKHIKGISGIVAPTVNSYKRLVPGYEAPVYICWGSINRSALIRVPATRGKESSARCELRCPDPSANPYLAFAAMLMAGFDGIDNKEKLVAATEEDVYEFDDSKLKARYIETLPGSLGEAIYEMENSPIVKMTLGDAAFEKYIAAKKKEWNEYKLHVSEWEMEQYFKKL